MKAPFITNPKEVTTVYYRHRVRRVSPFMDWWRKWPAPFEVNTKQCVRVRQVKQKQLSFRVVSEPSPELKVHAPIPRARVTEPEGVRRWLRELKDKCSCIYCEGGIKLHFHHTDPRTKRHEIHKMLDGTFTKEEILKEMAKCIVVCSKCHLAIHRYTTEQRKSPSVHRSKGDFPMCNHHNKS